jgi:hypothetical protein
VASATTTIIAIAFRIDMITPGLLGYEFLEISSNC